MTWQKLRQLRRVTSVCLSMLNRHLTGALNGNVVLYLMKTPFTFGYLDSMLTLCVLISEVVCTFLSAALTAASAAGVSPPPEVEEIICCIVIGGHSWICQTGCCVRSRDFIHSSHCFDKQLTTCLLFFGQPAPLENGMRNSSCNLVCYTTTEWQFLAKSVLYST